MPKFQKSKKSQKSERLAWCLINKNERFPIFVHIFVDKTGC